MYILNASVEAPYIGVVRFDLLRCNVSSVTVTTITNAVVLPFLKMLPSNRVCCGLNITNW